MQKPNHQLFFTYASYFLAGFLAFGTFLDGVANAISLITFHFALLGSIIIVVLLISGQFYLNRYPLPWVVNGQMVKISKINLGLLLPFLGMIIAFVMPVRYNFRIKFSL